MRKRSYLYRLIGIIIGLFLSIIVFFTYFWKKSFEEMETANEIYYGNVVEIFENSFHEKLEGFKKHVSYLVAESKDTKCVLWNGGELLKNEYWRHDVIYNTQYKFFEYNSIPCAIYYYDLDLLLQQGSTMSSEQYLKLTLNVTDENAEIIDCFDRGNYEQDKIMFAAIGATGMNRENMLVGYCTSLGKNRDKVMIFCLFGDSSYWDVGKGNEETTFYILNKDTNQIYLKFGKDTDTVIDWENIDTKVGGYKSAYREEDSQLPLAFALSVTMDSLQSNIVGFYRVMKNIIIVVVVLLLLICGVSIYIAYRPIYQLTSDLDRNGIGEMESIRNTLDDRRTKILEQEMLILDLLLSHLIYGVPLSSDKIVHLGIGKEMKYYCVVLADDCVLLNGEIQHLTDEIENTFSVRVFMQEWQEENRSIMVFFMKNNIVDELETHIKMWLEIHSTESARLLVGNVVDQLDDIRASFLSCFKKKEESETQKINVKNEVRKLQERTEQLDRLKEEVLAYIELHYRDKDMSQTMVADHFQISNYTLSRMFKNQVGVGFTDYVNSKRLELAKELLLTTSYSVREISLMVGFSSDNYFYRLFKTTIGVSTSVFREKK